MNRIALQIIIDELDEIARSLYDESIEKIDASFKIDKLIDELNDWMPYIESGI